MANWRFVGGMLSIIAAFGIYKDYNFGARHINEIYCMLDSFDAREVQDISLDIVVDTELEGKKSFIKSALETAKEAYMDEFGINFKCKFISEKLPYMAFTIDDYLAAVSNKHLEGDITLIFSKSHFLIGNQYGPYYEHEILAGEANLMPPAAVVFPSIDMNEKNLSAVIVHEIAHLFYAGHISGADCYMHSKIDVKKTPDYRFCEPTKRTIRQFKKRFWKF